MNRISVINTILGHTGARTYLEIGVKPGLTFMQVNAEKRTGVDPGWPGLKFYWYVARKRQTRFFKMTSDRFFEKRRPMLEKEAIDIALVDGFHEYHQSLRDVENCLKYLSPGGAIVMHDCNPQSEAVGLVPVHPRRAAAGKPARDVERRRVEDDCVSEVASRRSAGLRPGLRSWCGCHHKGQA